MIIKGRSIRIGSWAEPYVEEILRGGYVHNPVYYIAGEGQIKFQRDYEKSWSNTLKKIKKAGHDIIEIYDHRGGNTIFMLRKSFFNLSRRRLIEEKDGYKMYRLEDRNIFFHPNKDRYQVVSCRTTIEDILLKTIEDRLDRKG